jgi:hypothetical protein
VAQPDSPQAAQAAVPPQQTRPQAPPAALKLDSRVVSSFPPLFDEFPFRFIKRNPEKNHNLDENSLLPVDLKYKTKRKFPTRLCTYVVWKSCLVCDLEDFDFPHFEIP